MGGFINNKEDSVLDKFGKIIQMNKLELGPSRSNVNFLLSFDESSLLTCHAFFPKSLLITLLNEGVKYSLRDPFTRSPCDRHLCDVDTE